MRQGEAGRRLVRHGKARIHSFSNVAVRRGQVRPGWVRRGQAPQGMGFTKGSAVEEKVKAAELVLDFNLYPRHHLDESNVSSIKAALAIGEVVPPVLADRKSKRVTDGFHRITAVLRRDEDATIIVKWKDYASEQEMVLDAIALNARHGTKLTPYDRVRCVELADRLSIDMALVAGALALDVGAVDKMRTQRMAFTPSGGIKPIKRDVRHLAGQALTEKQWEANGKSQGWPLHWHVEQILNALDGDIVDWSDERNEEALSKLALALTKRTAQAAI